ncbi:MAG: hypothetical protein JST22_00395 [Bacteroidetes bacterium]|nr:hypothetical protein [Bacteroidota bacterium]
MRRARRSLAVFLFILSAGGCLNARPSGDTTVPDPRGLTPFIVDTIIVSTSDLYQGIQRTWVVSDVLEFFHVVTKERPIRHELHVRTGDTVWRADLDDIEQNLRQLGIFAEIDLHVERTDSADLDEGEIPHGRLYIRTRDAISLRGGASYTQSSDSRNYFLGLTEYNLFGLAKQFGASLYYTTQDNLGLTYSAAYYNPNIVGTHAYVSAAVGLSDRQHSYEFVAGRPYFSDRTPYAGSLFAYRFTGDALYYFHTPTGAITQVDDIRQTLLKGWYSGARNTNGSVFTMSAALFYDRTLHNNVQGIHRAFENSVGVFVGIGSRRRTFTEIQDADFQGTEQVPLGGMGSVSIGKISPHDGGLDNVFYIGADARQAVSIGDFYGFASVAAGSGLAGQTTSFVTQNASLGAAVMTHPGAFAMRLDESVVWNWQHYLYLPLDNLNGLRGYPRLENFGDNRAVLNIEYRLVPIFRFIVFDVGAAAFYDVGGTWRQSQQLSQVQFHSGAGIGIRVANADAKIAKGLFRVDLAYNFEQKKFAQLIIGTQEAFSFFDTFEFRPPGPYTY